MKTNTQMLSELDKEYTPERRGVVTMKEIYQINAALCLDAMDELQLRNLRDSAVMWFSFTGFKDEMASMDKMSAITSVIDQKLRNIGAEV